MSRPSWNQFWMKQAYLYATRATCDRLHVGCVLVKDNRLVSAGYNGSLSGLPHCDDVDHLYLEGTSGCQRTTHAEANAIAQAARLGHSTDNCVAYVTTIPCLNCFKLLHTGGIKTIYFGQYYRHDNEFLENFARSADVKMVHYPLGREESDDAITQT